jgi:hypothetical protein
MEEQDASPYRVSDEQVAEVERRLAEPNPKFPTLEEVRGALCAPGRMRIIIREAAASFTARKIAKTGENSAKKMSRATRQDL